MRIFLMTLKKKFKKYNLKIPNANIFFMVKKTLKLDFLFGINIQINCKYIFKDQIKRNYF